MYFKEGVKGERCDVDVMGDGDNGRRKGNQEGIGSRWQAERINEESRMATLPRESVVVGSTKGTEWSRIS